MKIKTPKKKCSYTMCEKEATVPHPNLGMEYPYCRWHWDNYAKYEVGQKGKVTTKGVKDIDVSTALPSPAIHSPEWIRGLNKETYEKSDKPSIEEIWKGAICPCKNEPVEKCSCKECVEHDEKGQNIHPSNYDEGIEDCKLILKTGRRLAIRQSINPTQDWFLSYSPRNDNCNAEGPLKEWVELAKGILKLAKEDSIPLSKLQALKKKYEEEPLGHEVVIYGAENGDETVTCECDACKKCYAKLEVINEMME